MFSTRFLRTKKVDKSYTLKILIFTLYRHRFNLICIPLCIRDLCITVSLECCICVMPVCLCNTVVSHQLGHSCNESLKESFSTEIMKKLKSFITKPKTLSHKESVYTVFYKKPSSRSCSKSLLISGHILDLKVSPKFHNVLKNGSENENKIQKHCLL